MKENYYTVDQVSKLLEMHPKTIRRFIREGKLGASRVGKQYRISGHDLSMFTGNDHQEKTVMSTESIKVSTVVDLEAMSSDDASRISNMLIAASNQKGKNYGKASLNTQYIKEESKLRLMLWGSIEYTRIMLESIEMLAGNDNDSL